MTGRAATFLMGLVLLGGAWASAALASTTLETSRPLPFLALSGPNGRFTASNLTAVYEKDPTSLLNRRGPRIDLAQLDRHGHFPYGDTPIDPNEKSLVESTQPQEVADVSPTEREELTPPKAGAHVGIPSAAAATGALIGGLAILIKILTLGI